MKNIRSCAVLNVLIIKITIFNSIEDTLRGFSEAIRVGRFAFLSPLQSAEGKYSSKLIRISLGDTDIGKFHSYVVV